MSHATIVRAGGRAQPRRWYELPPALLELLPLRLRVVSVIAIAGATGAFVLGPAAGAQGNLYYVACIVNVVTGLAGVALSYLWRERPGRIQWFAVAWLVIQLSMVELAQQFLPLSEGRDGPTAMLLLFVLIVPLVPNFFLAVALPACTFATAVALLGSEYSSIPLPPNFLPQHAFQFLASILIGYFASRAVHNLGQKIEEARELGSYRLGERLGAGGMGEVWRAEHRLLARPAAIKIIHPRSAGAADSTSAETLVKRFEREAKATSLLTSPHTVEIYDFGRTAEGDFYYVMELLKGIDLERLVRSHGPMKPARVIHFLRQACESLDEAHHAGLVHRDIKPANMIACLQGRRHDFLKILDFGLVKPAGGENGDARLTADTAVAGTPAYIAPEMAMGGEAVDSRADLYGLGCVAYWLLTGKLVFEAERPLDLLIKHAKEEPEPPSTRTELEIPPALEAIIMRCLRKSPGKRFPGAAELDKALAALELEEWSSEQATRWWARHEPGPGI